jgi:hypothetical protein
MVINSLFNVYYYAFINGAEWKFTPSEMTRFFEESSPHMLSTVMSVIKEFELHDGRLLRVTLFERGQPRLNNAIYNMVGLDFYDRMYIDYFNVYNQPFIRPEISIQPTESVMP